MDDDSLHSIDTKLSIIINLLMRKEEMSIKDKVALLENVSISYKDAARILGISEKHYSKEKSLLKKSQRGAENEEKESGSNEKQSDQQQS